MLESIDAETSADEDAGGTDEVKLESTTALVNIATLVADIVELAS